MTIADRLTLDCRGMRCPAPILAISRTVRDLDASVTTLEVLADDDDFPVDLKAWCRTTGAMLDAVDHEGGVYTARVRLAEAEDPVQAEVEVESGVDDDEDDADDPTVDTFPAVEVDCIGMLCPAPILEVSRAHKALGDGFGVLTVRADDDDFPVDLRAWCRSTGSVLASIDVVDGVHVAVVHANPGRSVEVDAPATLTSPNREETPALATLTSPNREEPPPPEPLDLTGEAPDRLVLQLGAAWLAAPGELTFRCDAAAEGHLRAWADLVSLATEVQRDAGHLVVRLRARSGAEVAAPPPPSVPVVVPVPVVEQAQEVPRRNATTLLVLRNDFESLMAAMMVANASAAQGMEVSVYFSFWGVNLLRGERPVARREEAAVARRPSLLHRMMKWMMPRGPHRQTMSKMNMGGMGLGMMKHFMRKQNVLGLAELLEQAVDMGVTFKVCTMSMGIMGIEKRELMDLPNIEFGGVTAFTADARTSASSMVF